MEKNWIKNSQEIAEMEEDEEEEEIEEKNENELVEISEEKEGNSQDKNSNIKKDFKFLLNGDIIIEEKIEERKRRNKKCSKFKNKLNEKN